MSSRPHGATFVLLAPAVLAAGIVIALEGWRLVRPRSPLFAPAASVTLAEALERHDVARAYALLQEGQTPDDLIVVNHPVLTGGRERFVSPLWWAVALRDEHAVLMLIERGATIRHADGRDADCLADALGYAAISEILRRYAAPPVTPCPAPQR